MNTQIQTASHQGNNGKVVLRLINFFVIFWSLLSIPAGIVWIITMGFGLQWYLVNRNTMDAMQAFTRSAIFLATIGSVVF